MLVDLIFCSDFLPFFLSSLFSVLQLEEAYRSIPGKQERGEMVGSLRQQARAALVAQPAAQTAAAATGAAAEQQQQQQGQAGEGGNGAEAAAVQQRYEYPAVSMALKVRRLTRAGLSLLRGYLHSESCFLSFPVFSIVLAGFFFA